MTTIYKYQLKAREHQTVLLPLGASILRVEEVDGLLWLWAIIDTEVEKEERYLEFYKTGQEITTPLDKLTYLGCCKLFIGQELCLYVFENKGI